MTDETAGATIGTEVGAETVVVTTTAEKATIVTITRTAIGAEAVAGIRIVALGIAGATTETAVAAVAAVSTAAVPVDSSTVLTALQGVGAVTHTCHN